MAATHKSARQRLAADKRLAYQYKLIDALRDLLNRSAANPVTDADIEIVAIQFDVEIIDLSRRWKTL
jgi:hypothetical protein